jgi:membrane-associated phospholipid phosphatase
VLAWSEYLKDKQNQPVAIFTPEIEFHGIWKSIFSWMGRVPFVVWPSAGTVLIIVLALFMPRHLWSSLWSGIIANLALVALVLIFSLIAVSLFWSAGQRIDVWVFKCFNLHGWRAPWLDRAMLGATQIGNVFFILIVVVILFLRVQHLLAYELAVGALALGLAVDLIKALIHRTRPYIKLKGIRIIGSRAGGQSFPSGHTSQTFYMVTLLLHYYQIGILLWVLLYAIASLVGITRIYLGMHYPRDVLAGAMLGTAWGLIGVIVNSHILGYI